MVVFVEVKRCIKSHVKFLAPHRKYNCYIPALPLHLLWMSVFLCKETVEKSESFPRLSLPKLFWNDRTQALDLSKVFVVVTFGSVKKPQSRAITCFH